MGQPQPSLSPPSFCHPFFCHSYSRFFAVPILAWQLRRRLYSRRDPFSNAMGQPKPISPAPIFLPSIFLPFLFSFLCGPDSRVATTATLIRPTRSLLQRHGTTAAISLAPIFLPSIFLPFPLSPFSANLSGSSDRGVDRASPRLSAARRSAKSGTNAFISPRPFGCGCAALRSMVYGPWSIMSHAWLTENPS